ncbi:MAG: sigma-70 family RNA polymerase sigma factor [Bacteroidales bacterium]|nr:sigma-70 family RNA polymerase sigma factor [Bacteroidales bacterium]
MMKLEMAEKMEHADLIEACRMHDRQAQEKVYDLYCKAMYNASFRILNHSAEAEDIMQESFIEAFEKLNTFRGEGTFGSWLKRIVVNNSINHLRKKKETSSLNDETIDVADSENDDREYSENLFCRLEEVRNGIRNLPENYRMILSLHLLEGYDHEEITEITGLSYGNVRTTFSRAKQKLLQLIMLSRNKQII